MLGFITTLLGALLVLDLAVFFEFERAAKWIYFSIFFGTLLWAIVVVALFWERKTNGRKRKISYQFMAGEAVCATALLVSAAGLHFEAIKSYAIIVDTLITFAFYLIFVYLFRDKFSVR